MVLSRKRKLSNNALDLTAESKKEPSSDDSKECPKTLRHKSNGVSFLDLSFRDIKSTSLQKFFFLNGKFLFTLGILRQSKIWFARDPSHSVPLHKLVFYLASRSWNRKT